jgi:hypothetical protein
MNCICGCEGQGYAGADTSTKKVVLAWLPRTAAILYAGKSVCVQFKCDFCWSIN